MFRVCDINVTDTFAVHQFSHARIFKPVTQLILLTVFAGIIN